MELLIKRILVLSTALLIAVPSVYLTLAFYSGTQYEKQPLNFIPADANLVSLVKSESGNYYIYVDNGSLGLITSLSVFLIPQLTESPTISGNVTKNVTLQYYEEYKGVSIFQLDGIDAWTLFTEYAGNITYMSIFVNESLMQAELTNVTLYIASPQNTFSVIGTVPLLEKSIDSYIGHTSILTVRNIEFDPESNVSLYYFPPQSGNVGHVSMNLTDNYTEAYLSFTSLNSSVLFSVTSLAQRYPIEVHVGQNYIELISSSGINSIRGLLSSNGPVLPLLEKLQSN